jgi:23S rRNA (pseudouridine1915-N3)-methyltransferase
MKVRVVWIGKTRSKELSTLIEDFVERLRRFVTIDITEIRDPKAGDDQRQMAAEEERLLAALDSNDRVVVLDVAGQSWSSPQLAQFLSKHLGNDPRRLTFVIGGYGGLSKDLKARAELKWSLSPLTFTHEMTRVLVVEQLYRAMCILNNHPYSK